MKHTFQACCFIVISLIFVTTGHADSYRAQGEFFYDNGQNMGMSSRSFKSTVVSDDPVNLMMGNHVISLVFDIEPPPSDKYTLTIKLKSNPKQSNQIATTFFTNTYQLTLVGGSNGPFEFEEELNGTKFGGALGLSLRKGH